VAPPVVAVVAGDDVLPLRLLLHHDLVDASLFYGASPGNCIKGNVRLNSLLGVEGCKLDVVLL